MGVRESIQNIYEYCSYCRNKMKIARVSVKRPVPPGAKDLNISDEVVCWRCPQCQQTTTAEISKCSCGSYILARSGVPAPDAYEQGAPKFQARLTRVIDARSDETQFTYGCCTACEKCAGCGLPINSLNLISESSYTEYDEEQDKYVYFREIYYHEPCFDKKQKEEIARKRLEEEENKRRLEEQQKQREQAERQKRIKNSLCITCGSPLGFTDKLTGRQSHKRC